MDAIAAFMINTSPCNIYRFINSKVHLTINMPIYQWPIKPKSIKIHMKTNSLKSMLKINFWENTIKTKIIMPCLWKKKWNMSVIFKIGWTKEIKC